MRRYGHFLTSRTLFSAEHYGELGRENCTRTFNAHNAKVQERVPADRLLLFRVEDGWESLCEFLGHPVPHEPFPHVNEGVETIRAWPEKALVGS